MPSLRACVILGAMRSGVLAIIAACSACAKAPAFEDPGTPVTVVENGLGRTVVGPGYQMAFHGGEALELHLPESLTVGGVEVLGAGVETFFERNIGFGLFPAFIAAADDAGIDSVTASTITTNDDGPFVAQIRTELAFRYQCGTVMESFKATSVFTFFPNGRIVRHDLDVQGIANPSPILASAFACNSFAPPNPILTSWWAFGGDSTVDAGGVEVQANARPEGACTRFTQAGSERSIAVVYDGEPARIMVPQGVRAHVHDFFPATATSFDNTSFQVSSRVQLAGSAAMSCAQLLDQLAQPPIRVGSDQLAGPNPDGIYTDPSAARSAAFDVEVIGDVPVPAGWVLSTQLSSDLIQITRDGQDVSYNVQRLEPGQNNFLIIINEPLAPGSRVTIEPL